MSVLIETLGTIGDTYYVVLRTGVTAWDGDSWEDEAGGVRDDFDLPMTETPADSGRFVLTFPAAIVSGEYSATIYRRAGATAANTDLPVGLKSLYYDADTPLLVSEQAIANIKEVTDALTVVAAAKLAISAGTIVVGSAKAGTLSKTQMSTTLIEDRDNHYNNRAVIWTSGVLANQAKEITDYDGKDKILTFNTITVKPTAGDSFIIV